ncbi:hypothetical protein QN372_20660 [Undibacterium sp. RTI2.1]|uniref:hypothetical protein n=1 Tax=unclassified Undibacterium TaxID=2630295 RepID=UPI002B22F607|nr:MULTISPECIES: hypothetical protein [unclassified Undibacterium]MEB0033155.1 hypothetical protein [Undibacterium sp. RTI2.1]MEB0118957.1 hypothetical protein [Undibacterium sp. RTI2.2]
MIRKLNIQRLLKLFVGTACAGALIYGGAFYFMSIGGAFTEFQNWCARSQGVVATVGIFQKAELVPFGSSFFEKVNGDEGTAAFNARVVGVGGSVVVDVAMTKKNDKWEVDKVLISGKPLDSK